MRWFVQLFTFCLVLSSCNYTVIKDPNALKIGAQGASSVGFTEVQSKVLTPYCLSCHGWASAYPTVLNLIGAIEARVLDGSMPKNSVLPAENKALLLGWIKNGAPEVAGPAGPGPITPPPVLEAKFSSIFKLLIEPRCASCHRPDGEAEFILLHSKEAIYDLSQDLFDLQKPRKSLFLKVLRGEEDVIMPPPPSSRILESQIIVIENWIKQGLPQ